MTQETISVNAQQMLIRAVIWEKHANPVHASAELEQLALVYQLGPIVMLKTTSVNARLLYRHVQIPKKRVVLDLANVGLLILVSVKLLGQSVMPLIAYVNVRQL